jgi:hypothetical protein
MSKEQIAEMRKFVEETTVRPAGANKEKSPTFRNAPDWAIRRLYEVRKGLTLTPLPDSAYRAAANKAIRAETLTEQDKLKMRLIVAEIL